MDTELYCQRTHQEVRLCPGGPTSSWPAAAAAGSTAGTVAAAGSTLQVLHCCRGYLPPPAAPPAGLTNNQFGLVAAGRPGAQPVPAQLNPPGLDK